MSARVVKENKLRVGAGKYKLGAGAGKYKLRAGCQGPRNTNTLIWCFSSMFFGSIKEINRLISKGMSNILRKTDVFKSSIFSERNFEEMQRLQWY